MGVSKGTERGLLGKTSRGVLTTQLHVPFSHFFVWRPRCPQRTHWMEHRACLGIAVFLGPNSHPAVASEATNGQLTPPCYLCETPEMCQEVPPPVTYKPATMLSFLGLVLMP